MARATLFAALLALLAVPAAAQDDGGFGDGAGGFGEAEEGFGDSAFPAETDGQSQEAGPGLPDWLSLGGTVSAQAAVGYRSDLAERWRGLNRTRLRGDGEVELQLPRGVTGFASATAWYDPIYRLRGRDSYTDAVLDSYESELALREAYLAGSAGPFDAKLGRQKIVWGRADSLQVTDRLTPVDRRDAGALDLGDTRRPVTAARLDGYRGPWQATAAAILAHRGDATAPVGDPLYPAARELPEAELRDVSLDTIQPALALTGRFTGWDASAYWARPFQHRPYLAGRPGNLRRGYARLSLAGAAASAQAGDAILRAEAARLTGLRYQATGDERFARHDAMAGVEYGGFASTTLIAELGVRHYPGFAASLDQTPEYVRETRLPWVLRGSRDFLRDKLELVAAARGFALRAGDGGLARLQASYELTDALTLTGKSLTYWEGDAGPLRNAGDADRLYTELSYAF